MLHFIFPRDMSNPACPDEMFVDQWTELVKMGFSASTFSDSVTNGTSPLRIASGNEVVYRGWMLKSEEYAAIVRAIEQCGADAFIGHQEYLNTHHLPNWYPLLTELTPETRVFPVDANIVAELQALGWGAYFLKDYVKSLKTARGSIVFDPTEAPAVIAEMQEYRGEIEGGICVRRVEDFVPQSEQRYFVLCGKPYATSDASPVLDIVQECAERVPSKFFSVDIATRRDGKLRIVEIGDGQVSDLVGWSATRFASIWL